MTISCSVTVLTAQYYTVVAATVLIVSIMPIPGADKNSLLQALPRFKQIVTQPTHGNKTIDVIIMNCADLYAVPQVGAPVLPDNPRQAKPSDHRVPVARPLATAARPVSNEYTVKTYRPLPESAVREFQAWIHAEEWGELALHSSPSRQVEAFQKIVDTKFPAVPRKKSKIIKPRQAIYYQ